MINKTNFKTSIGGQALIEGILMRGPKKQAIVCYNSKNGYIEKVEELKFIKDKFPILGLPIIRGIITFLDSMVKGMSALTYSADLLPEEEQAKKDAIDIWIDKHFSEETAKKLIISIAVILGIALSVFLFIILPTTIVGLIPKIKDIYLLRNLFEGVLKVIILLVYIKLCTMQKDVKRLFAYHGAEHKVIFCYEHGNELTIANVKKESRFHPRCGTSFLLVVVIVSIIVNSIIQSTHTITRILFHLLLLPVVVGISYEINRWCGLHDNKLSCILSSPGKKLQNMTTNEPDDIMIECAIRSLKLVIPSESGTDEWGK